MTFNQIQIEPVQIERHSFSQLLNFSLISGKTNFY